MRRSCARWKADEQPWEELATLNDQVDTVRRAVSANLLEPEPQPEPPLGPWRATVAQVKALAPLVGLFRLEALDPADPASVDRLADTVRRLRQVRLPPLADVNGVMRAVGRADAVARLRDSLGVDPRTQPFERVRAAVQRRADKVAELLPDTVRLHDGVLSGMPERQPNPGLLVNAPTVRDAMALTPATLSRLRWQVPDWQDLPLLTSALPVAALARALGRAGPNPVRQSPCGPGCDAADAARASA